MHFHFQASTIQDLDDSSSCSCTCWHSVTFQPQDRPSYPALGGDASFFHRKQFKIPGKSNENPPQVSSIGSSSKFLANQMNIPPLCFFFDKRVSPNFIQSKRSGPIAGKPTGPSSLSRQRKRLGIGNPYLHFISP
jgi:hypothetical protein